MLDLIFQAGVALAVIGVGLLGGYGALSFAWTDWRAWSGYLASAGWPTVPGRITHSAVVPIRTRRSVNYQPEVRYTFTVDGRAYTGGQLTFTSWTQWLSLAEAERLVAPYPAGAAVLVRYDPRHPPHAVLERRAPGGLFASCGIVALLAGSSGLCLFTGLMGLAAGR